MADAPPRGWPEEHDVFAQGAGFQSWPEWIDHLETHTKAGKPRRSRRKICGAKIPKGTEGRSQAGTPCCKGAGTAASKSGKGGKETGHKGWGRCGSHAGLSLAGKDHPNYKDGHQSIYKISGALGEAYRAASASLSMVEDIRLANARVMVALDGLPENCPTPAQFLKRIAALKAALDSGNARAVLAQMNGFSGELKDTELHWKQIKMASEAQEQKRRLVDTELKRITREHGPVSWTDMMMIADEAKTMLADLVDRFVPEGQRSVEIKRVANLGGTGPAAMVVPDGFN